MAPQVIAASRPWRVCFAALGGVLLLGAGCSDGTAFSAEERESVMISVRATADRAGVSLSLEDAECVVDAVDSDLAIALDAEILSDLDRERFSTELVGCVGSTEVATAVLLPEAGGIRTSSLECAAGELDREFLVTLLSSALGEQTIEPRGVELEVQFALAVCLGLDELGVRADQ